MNIEHLKEDFKKMKSPYMDIACTDDDGIKDFLRIIRNQEGDDKRYLLKKKILPVFLGLVCLTIVFMSTSMNSVLIFSGSLMVYSSLTVILVLFLRDYRNISIEFWDLSLREFLEEKELRLKSWKTTKMLYHAIFIAFITGLMIMNICNPVITRDVKTFVIYISAYFGLLLFFGITGEYYYRKRYKEKHVPILDMILKMKNELDEE